MLVVDTSAILEALVSETPDERLTRRLSDDGDLHAPHLVDIEFLRGLRRLVMRGEFPLDRAEDARTDFADLTIVRYPHQPLADRMWELRHNLTGYDAAFVALAELLQTPLITCDSRLAGPGHRARSEVYGTLGSGGSRD